MKWIKLNDVIIGDLPDNRVVLTMMGNKRMFAYNISQGIKGLCEVQKHHPEALCLILTRPDSSHPEQGEQGDKLRNDAELFWHKHRVTFKGVNGGDYIDKEDWDKFINTLCKLSSPPPEGQDERIKELESAIAGILKEPYGCPMCDSGVLRNKDKEHWDECPFLIAQNLIK